MQRSYAVGFFEYGKEIIFVFVACGRRDVRDAEVGMLEHGTGDCKLSAIDKLGEGTAVFLFDDTRHLLGEKEAEKS